MATLFRRGKTWWLYTSCKGKRHRWSLRTTDERIAKQKLRKHEYELQTRGLELPTVTPYYRGGKSTAVSAFWAIEASS